ncbi:ankyrin [Zopfia rhizophila CBS 207.26]|uniref:Ankyrin n=1 Tax=Zopfia rhizophila CBS 207.26 TaxID=1314779 RepID=A0A6A6EX39_9PEZI|nr:ankyrin [Zopfia rhizophila CBS 207.26]
MLKSLGKRFRKPKLKELASESQQDQSIEGSTALPQQPEPPAISTPATARNERYGLFLLCDGKPLDDSQERIDVDIVAIHGLNGDAYSTWEHENVLEALLLFLRMTRTIVTVKILSATASVVFFGTPHRGAHGITDIGKAVGTVVNACLRVSQTAGITGTTRTDLLRTLIADSESLKDIAISFRNRLDNLDVVTFLETMTTPPLSDLVVDRHSAIMEIRDEEIIPLYANHLSMCRFEGKNQEYTVVSNAICRLARKALKNREIATTTNRDSSDRSLSEAEKSCMVLLNSTDLADYKAEMPRPVQGTCSWILSHPQYLSWIKTEETTLLWVTGEPGCGKTMLSAYLTEHLKLGRTAALRSQVFFFFCDDKITTQRDASAILRSILYQILQQHRRLIKHVKSRYESYGPSLANSFSTLWELFLKIAADFRSAPLGVIVDAIDECEEKTRRTFLNAVIQLVHESQELNRQPQSYIKFLITSRPSLGNSYNFNGFLKSRLPIEQNQSRIGEDVKLVISSKVGEIASRFGCSDEIKEYLEHVLYSRADHTFLWLDIVLQCIEDSLLASKKDIERIINTFPRDLEATYGRFLHRIPSGSREHARKILRLLIGSSRHLTLTEMNIAFTIDQDHKTAADVGDDCQPSIARTLQGIAGPFVRIKSSRVSLIHQSAKEFLTDLALHSQDPIIQSGGVPSVDAALSIAWSCIQYLLLQEFTTDLFAVERTSLETDSPISPLLMGVNTTVLDDLLGLEEDRIFKDQRILEEETCFSLAQQYEFFDYSATHWAEHFALCESIAPEGVREAARRLTDSASCVLRNWLKYFWIKANMEYPFPDNFDIITVAAFFNLSILLRESLERDISYDQFRKDRALFWAARMGSPKSVEALLQYNANPNFPGIDRHTPLTVSAQHGHLDVVKILLAEPCTEVSSKGNSGRSALSYAAGNGNLEIARALMNREDCQLEDQDNSRWTPLFWAVGGDHTAVINSLLSYPSIDINHVDKTGRSVISWAAGDGLLRALRVLLKHPQVDVNIKDSTGRSPLSWAAGNGHTEIVSALLRDRRVDKFSKDFDQRNIISWACQGGHTDTVRTLLKYECRGEDDEDVSGWTPLAWDLHHESTSTVEALISGRKVQIDRQDRGGRTALIWAASYGYPDVVQLLLSQGANPHTTDSGGRTAMDYAKMYSHMQVIEKLEAQ